MKRILTIIGLMLITMSITGCAVTQKEMSTNLKRKWMLISMKEFSKDELMHAKASLDLASKEGLNSNYSAFMGCNNLRFQIDEMNRNKLSVSGFPEQKCFAQIILI